MRTSAILILVLLSFSLSAFCEIEYIGSTGTTPLDFELYQAPNGKTYAYVVHGGAFSIVDVSDWRNPRVLKRVQLDADLAYDVSIWKDRLAAANGIFGVRFYSLSDPENPQEEFRIEEQADEVWFTHELAAVNTDTPPDEAPEQVFRYTFGRIETPTAFGVAALGNNIYIPGGDAGFYVFRINDDSNVNEWALH